VTRSGTDDKGRDRQRGYREVKNKGGNVESFDLRRGSAEEEGENALHGSGGETWGGERGSDPQLVGNARNPGRAGHYRGETGENESMEDITWNKTTRRESLAACCCAAVLKGGTFLGALPRVGPAEGESPLREWPPAAGVTAGASPALSSASRELELMTASVPETRFTAL
jgi:hypothetical protein